MLNKSLTVFGLIQYIHNFDQPMPSICQYKKNLVPWMKRDLLSQSLNLIKTAIVAVIQDHTLEIKLFTAVFFHFKSLAIFIKTKIVNVKKRFNLKLYRLWAVNWIWRLHHEPPPPPPLRLCHCCQSCFMLNEIEFRLKWFRFAAFWPFHVILLLPTKINSISIAWIGMEKTNGFWIRTSMWWLWRTITATYEFYLPILCTSMSV